MRGKIILIVLLLSIKVGLVQAQDMQFSQFYAAPIYLNPAFTGSTEWTRVGVNYRNQWPGLDRSFNTFSAYFDHFIDHKNSGVGVIANGVRDSFSQVQNMEIGLTYSYRIKLGEESYLHSGVQASFVHRNVNVESIILGTQIDIDRGIVVGDGVNWVTDVSQRSHEDINAGLYYYDQRYWLGVAAHHLTRPHISFLQMEDHRLPIRFAVHGGATFNLFSNNIGDVINNTLQERTLSLAFNYKRQGLFDQLDVGAEFFYAPLMLGAWYRGLPTKHNLPNNEAIIALVGFSLPNDLQIGYSFDFTVSKLAWRNSGGAHEISIRYTIRNYKLGKKRDRDIPGFK
ncbi:type IX secretion system membrane protein PorP/SprF, partial [uncultured Cyclobacterium sp.]|uniref:PorP/SprF family type IX secretion system membrane protein n=1 Tax=uncultured Cyclobacterium sp. TaxID=453820 RepID=UPI0030EBBEC9